MDFLRARKTSVANKEILMSIHGTIIKSSLLVVALLFCLPFALRDPAVTASGNQINGSGGAGRIAKFSGSQCIGNSEIRENPSGNVAISSSPVNAAKLLVGGTLISLRGPGSPSLIAVKDDSSGSEVIAQFIGDVLPGNVPVEVMRVQVDGNVGIGTPSPNSPLEVAGIIHSTIGGVMFPDATVQTSAAFSPPPIYPGSFVSQQRARVEMIATAGRAMGSHTRDEVVIFQRDFCPSVSFQSHVDSNGGVWERISAPQGFRARRLSQQLCTWGSCPRFYAKIRTGPDYLDIDGAIRISVGFFRTEPHLESLGAFFDYQGSPGDPNGIWVCKSGTGGNVEETPVTLLPVLPSTEFDLEIHISDTQVEFFINGQPEPVAVHEIGVGNPNQDLGAGVAFEVSSVQNIENRKIDVRHVVADYKINP